MADSGGKRLKRGGFGLSLPKVAVKDVILGGLAVLAAVVLGWVLFVDDPLGGKPVAVVSLDELTAPPDPTDPTSEGTADGTDPQAADGDSARIRQVPEAGAPLDTRAPGSVLIIDASRAGQPVVVASADPSLAERGPHGALPRISDDGRSPARHYARSAPGLAADQPKIAVVLGGMGLSVSASEDAIRRLPGGVTMAFAPYGRDLPRIAANAAQDGHEIMLQVPLEPFDYPDNDPGPHTLLSNLPERQNLDRLHWVMSRFMGYTGLASYMGARFSASERALEPVLKEVRDRGLLMFDDGTAPQSRIESISDRLGLPATRADVVLDAVPRRDDIDRALRELEEIALNRGYAVGSLSALPVSVQALEAWTDRLDERGIALVPLTSIVFRGSS